MSLEFKKRLIKLVLVLTTSTPIIGTKEKAIETTKTTGASKNGKESKSEYPKNLA